MKISARFVEKASLCLVTAVLTTSCQAGPAPEPVSLDVVATNLGTFEPTEYAVTPGTEVTFLLRNEGATEHDLVVVGEVFGLESELHAALEEDPGLEIAATDLVPGGGSTALVVTFDRPCTYQYFCSVLNHFATGMRGQLTVRG